MYQKIKKITSKLFSTGFFHVFGSSTINQVLSFLSGLILVRVLSKPDYGCFGNAFSIYQFFIIFSGLGAASGILQMCSEYSDKPELSNKIYSFAFRNGVLINIGISLAVLLCALFVPFEMEGTNELLACFCVMPVFTLMYEMSIAKLRGDIRAKDYSYANIANVVLYCALSILGAFLFRSKGLIFGRTLAYILSIILIFKKFKVIPSFDKGENRIEGEIKSNFIKVSLVSTLNNGLSTMFDVLEVFLLGIVVADSNVTASYKVAAIIPSALLFVPLAFATYVYPYFAKHIGDTKWVRKYFSLSILGLGVINLLITVIMIVIAEPFVRIAFGAEYLDCVPILKLLMFGFFVGGTFRVLPGNLLVSQRKLAYNTIVGVIGCVVSIVSNILFINKFGSIGAAYAHITVFAVTSVLYTGAMLYFTRKKAE